MHLPDAPYYLIETYRADGSPAHTPVWGAWQADRLQVWTGGDSYKVRRIRKNGAVRVAPCNARGTRVLGPWQRCRAHVVEDTAAIDAIRRALRNKYGCQLKLIELSLPLRGKRIQDYVGLSLTPVLAS